MANIKDPTTKRANRSAGDAYDSNSKVARKGTSKSSQKGGKSDEDYDEEEENRTRRGAAGVTAKEKGGKESEFDDEEMDLDGHGDDPPSGNQWIAGAIKHKGALHRELGVPEGHKIPKSKIAKAAHSDNPTLAKRARLAETLSKMHHGRRR